MRGFSESDTKELIALARKLSERGEGLSTVFKKYAFSKNRAPGSIRNYYYKTIAECAKNKNLMQKLGVKEDMLPAFIKEFNEQEEKELLNLIFEKLATGKSVRRAVIELSNGSEKMALRYQNKYRNLLKLKREFVMETANEYFQKTGIEIKPYKQEDSLTPNKENFNKVKTQIDTLLKRLTASYIDENEELNRKLLRLYDENEKLRQILKKSMKEKNFTKDYFTAINTNQTMGE